LLRATQHLNQSVASSHAVLLPPIQLDSPLRSTSTVPKFISLSKLSPIGQRQCRRRPRQRDALEWCTSTTTSFDQLPWISALESPDQLGVRDHDFADLSKLDYRPSSRPQSDSYTSSGPGPVRRNRDALLRSSPRRAEDENDFDDYPAWLKSSSSKSGRSASSPRTPRNSRTPLSVSHARFHNLMPVFTPLTRPKCESDGFI